MCVGTTGRLTDFARSSAHKFLQCGRRSRVSQRGMDAAINTVRTRLVQIRTAPASLGDWQPSGQSAEKGGVLLRAPLAGLARRGCGRTDHDGNGGRDRSGLMLLTCDEDWLQTDE